MVAFSCRCPLARRLTPVLNELASEFGSQGIQLIGLFPNAIDDLANIAEYAVDTELNFPVFKDDAENPWHKQLGMTVTPEVVLLDGDESLDDD